MKLVYRGMLGFALFSIVTNSYALALRSFVAMPINKNGLVLRGINAINLNNGTNNLNGEAGYGLTAKQTIFATLIKPGLGQARGDLSLFDRIIVWQQDQKEGTNRFGLLIGPVVPMNDNTDGGVQGGGVASFYYMRNEVDIDAIWSQGFGRSPNTAQYDISWQYRIYPAVYPEWGLGSSVNTVLEFNGSYKESNATVQEATAGLQWVNPTWIVEGGFIRDIANGPHQTTLMLSVRAHIF